MRYIVPSRGRPQNVVRLARAFYHTMQLLDTKLTVCVDRDDSKAGQYLESLTELRDELAGDTTWLTIQVDARMRLNGTLNHYAKIYCDHEEAIGFMGDDHMPITPAWDAVFQSRLSAQPLSIVYGNDLIQGANIPTAVVLDARIVQTLGYMAPPSLTHLYLDNFWKDLGIALGTLHYEPKVLIEHLHPQAGKAEWDEGYAENNSGEVWQEDERMYGLYKSVNFANDVNKLLGLGLL